MIFAILIITAALLFGYSALILLYRFWLLRMKESSFGHHQNTVTFSVIIPARNEEDNIGNCLRSILGNNYPQNLYEIIVIDDDSEDNTAKTVHDMQLQHSIIKLFSINELLQHKKVNAHKKRAIESAIAKATGQWIITTDADCTVPVGWLSNFAHYIHQTGKIFIAAPVVFKDNHTFLGRFQCLDFLSLQGITAASVSAGFHSMCNGANLCYQKKLFTEIGGFSGIDHLASGDDMLLMHKVQKKYPDRIGYIFSQQSIVETLPMTTVKSFLYQRIRWASKAHVYDDVKITAVLIFVYLFNLCLLVVFILSLFHPHLFIYWISFLLVKTIIEMLFMSVICSFFQQQKLLKWFPLMQPFHILYTVIAGLLGRIGKYQWKGRTVK